MKRTSVMDLIRVASWVLFIGLCIKAGALLFSGISSLIWSDRTAAHLYPGIDLAKVLAYSKMHYIGLVALLFLSWGLKAYLFYKVIQIFSKLDVNRPFSLPIAAWIRCLSKIAVQIGILGLLMQMHGDWLADRGLTFSYDDSGTEFLYMAGILFIIAEVFKRGIELQSENELTV